MNANPFEKAAEKRVQCGGRAGKAGNGMVSHAEASFAWKGYVRDILARNQPDDEFYE